MVVDNAFTPRGERTRTVSCPFGQRSLCGPERSPRGELAHVFAPSIKQWDRALFAISDANTECMHLDKRVQRLRAVHQGLRPQSGSIVEQRRRELQRKREERLRNDEQRCADNAKADAKAWATLSTERQRAADTEVELATAVTRGKNVQNAHFQENEAARSQSLARGLEARAAHLGKLQWQRAVDNCLVTLADAYADDAAMRAADKQRRGAILRAERREDAERLRLSGRDWIGRQRPASAPHGVRPAGEALRESPALLEGERWLREMRRERRAHHSRTMAQRHMRDLQRDERAAGRRVDADVQRVRGGAWRRQLTVTKPSPRPGTPLQPPTAEAESRSDSPDSAKAAAEPEARLPTRPHSAHSSDRRRFNAEDLPRFSRPYSAHQRSAVKAAAA